MSRAETTFGAFNQANHRQHENAQEADADLYVPAVCHPMLGQGKSLEMPRKVTERILPSKR